MTKTTDLTLLSNTFANTSSEATSIYAASNTPALLINAVMGPKALAVSLTALWAPEGVDRVRLNDDAFGEDFGEGLFGAGFGGVVGDGYGGVRYGEFESGCGVDDEDHAGIGSGHVIL
ncbi:hypothetical protein HDU67_004548 [Dinochytrium kinnereticum]|nr:hypothetical protein HDU67_004548 [Dinochytrium kinnereticum]